MVAGQTQSHTEFKKIIARFARAFVDHEVELRVENDFDSEKVERDAMQHV